ncbi:MAG: arsenate reductase (glutaredoxin) [Pseudomonadota bacterium]
MALVIYHNPRCSKSRQTLALLEERGAMPAIRLYLEDPPSKTEIKALAQALGISSVRDMMRTKEAVYKDLALKDETNEAALIDAIAENPILIERPIVTNGKRAAIGRPPETVLGIL